MTFLTGSFPGFALANEIPRTPGFRILHENRRQSFAAGDSVDNLETTQRFCHQTEVLSSLTCPDLPAPDMVSLIRKTHLPCQPATG
jgi:hypothetical protein